MKFLVLIALTLSATAMANPGESNQESLTRELLGQIQKAINLSKKKGLPCSKQFLNDGILAAALDVDGIGTARFLSGGGSPEGNGQWREIYFGTVIAQPPNGSALLSLGFFVDINKNDCREAAKAATTIRIFSGESTNTVGKTSFDLEP